MDAASRPRYAVTTPLNRSLLHTSSAEPQEQPAVAAITKNKVADTREVLHKRACLFNKCPTISKSKRPRLVRGNHQSSSNNGYEVMFWSFKYVVDFGQFSEKQNRNACKQQPTLSWRASMFMGHHDTIAE